MNLSQPFYIEPRQGKHHLSLNGTWDFAYTDRPVEPGEVAWTMRTAIPNSVYWSLYEAGVTPHPYRGTGSKAYAWVDDKVWYYRRVFTVPPECLLDRAVLCVDGAAYYTRAWLNGTLLGEHEGMFGGPYAQVQPLLRPDAENELILEIRACDYRVADWDPWNTQGKPYHPIVPWNLARSKHTTPGDFIVIGLWGGARIEFLRDVHISRPCLTTRRIDGTTAHLHLQLEISDPAIEELGCKLDTMHYAPGEGYMAFSNSLYTGATFALQAPEYTLDILLVDRETGQTALRRREALRLPDWASSGTDPAYYECHHFHYDLMLEEARLWFPKDLGEPCLYDVRLRLSAGDTVLDEQRFAFGVRTFERDYTAGPQLRTRWDKFHFRVNGRPIFLKGMNWMPVDHLLRLDREEYRWTLETARDAGIQMLRVWSGGGIPESDDFYQLCDELGLLVWQDNLIANMDSYNWPMRELQAQVCMNLYRLRNHPSLVMHCGGNEFNPYSAGNLAGMSVITQAIEDLDPSRIFVRTSPDRGSAHVYRDMEPTWYRHAYRWLPFLPESGIHCFPNYKSLRTQVSAEECGRPLSNIYSEAFETEFPELRNHFMEFSADRVPRMLARASQIEDVSALPLRELVEATQLSTCEYYLIMVQAMREQYPVTGGILPWAFRRPSLAVGVQLVDGLGEPVAPYYYLKNAYQPLHAMLSLEQVTYAPGEAVRLLARVLNGGGEALPEAALRVTLYDRDWNMVYDREQRVSLEAGQYQLAADFGAYPWPEALTDSFLFARVTLRNETKLLSQSVYWPKALSALRDPSALAAQRRAGAENLTFPHGPWLKPQVRKGPGTRLEAALERVTRRPGRLEATLRLCNAGEVPAFPVQVDSARTGTVTRASDNFFLLGPGESRTIDLYIRNPEDAPLEASVSAWNAESIIVGEREG